MWVRLIQLLRLLLPLGFGLAALAAAERDERYSFPVEPGCTLKIDSYRGTVVVTESDEPRIQVLVQLEIGSDTEEQADRMRAALQLDVKAHENTVTIFARNPAESRIRWVWEEDRQIGLTYRISVPARCNVEVKIKNGNVNLGSLEGRVAVKLENGNVGMKRIQGSVDVTVGQGDLLVSRCLGNLTARLGQGSVRTGLVGGALQVETGAGDLDFMEVRGPVRASCEAGDLRISFPKRIGGNCQLVAKGGNIFVKIDPAASCWIEAASVWGEVATKLPLLVESGGSGQSRLAGRLNTGGPSLSIRASGGNVKLEPGETLFE